MNESRSWIITAALVLGWIGIVLMLAAIPSCDDPMPPHSELVKAHRDAAASH
jgi:hypothetical protein